MTGCVVASCVVGGRTDAREFIVNIKDLPQTLANVLEANRVAVPLTGTASALGGGEIQFRAKWTTDVWRFGHYPRPSTTRSRGLISFLYLYTQLVSLGWSAATLQLRGAPNRQAYRPGESVALARQVAP